MCASGRFQRWRRLPAGRNGHVPWCTGRRLAAPRGTVTGVGRRRYSARCCLRYPSTLGSAAQLRWCQSCKRTTARFARPGTVTSRKRRPQPSRRRRGKQHSRRHSADTRRRWMRCRRAAGPGRDRRLVRGRGASSCRSYCEWRLAGTWGWFWFRCHALWPVGKKYRPPGVFRSLADDRRMEARLFAVGRPWQGACRPQRTDGCRQRRGRFEPAERQILQHRDSSRGDAVTVWQNKLNSIRRPRRPFNSGNKGCRIAKPIQHSQVSPCIPIRPTCCRSMSLPAA